MSSDVDSLKRGIVKMTKNKANTPYTVLLVGETGVGKSSLVKFIANALHFYDPVIFVQGARDQDSPHLHEIASKNGVLVSANVFEHGVMA